MRMEMSPENQICSSSSSSSTSLCFSRNHLLFVAVLVFFLVSASFCSIIFTFSLLILSTFLVVFKFTNQKVGFEENLLKSETIQKNPSIHEVEDEVFKEVQQQKQIVHHDYCVLTKSSDLSSETESADVSSSSEDSDADLNEFTMFSDDSISDDESLIEIDLPGGHYIGAKEEAKFLNIEATLREFLKEPIFKKQSLMELLAEISNDMYEEENLIEIDISMGSIKCSRLEIEA